MNEQIIKLTNKEYIKLLEILNINSPLPEWSIIKILSTDYISDTLQYQFIGSWGGEWDLLSNHNYIIESFVYDKTKQALFNCLSSISSLQYKNDTDIYNFNITEFLNNRDDAISKLKDKAHELNKIIHSIDLNKNGWAII